MKWLRPATAVLCLLLLLSGCWNRREIETLGFALAAGIDWDDAAGEFEFTAQLAKPEALAKEAPGGGGKESAFLVFSARGRTVFAAIRNLTRVSPRRIWWGHNQVLVLGEAAARRGVLPALDFAARDGETRRLFWIVVTPGKARDILMQQPRAGRIGALVLLDMLRARGSTSTSGAVREHEFMIMLSAPIAATAGLVTLAERDGAGPSADFRLEGSAVFRQARLVGYLDATETRGMLWVRGRVRSGIIHVPCPGAPQEPVGLEIVHASASIRPELIAGKPSVTVLIRQEANLGDKACLVSLKGPEDFTLLAERQERAIRAEVNAALRRARELGTDVFGFGVRIQQELPAVWRDLEDGWESHFRTLPVKVQVEAKVRRQGLKVGTSPPK